MINAKLGEKRECAACAVKFYDLNKKPPVCPKCGAVYVPPKETAKGRKTLAKAPPKPAKKPVKKAAILDGGEDIALEGFEDVELGDDAENAIEEIDDLEEDVDSLSELEDREVVEDRVNSDDVDEEVLIEEIEADDSLVDSLEDVEDDEEDDEDDK